MSGCLTYLQGDYRVKAWAASLTGGLLWLRHCTVDQAGACCARQTAATW